MPKFSNYFPKQSFKSNPYYKAQKLFWANYKNWKVSDLRDLQVGHLVFFYYAPHYTDRMEFYDSSPLALIFENNNGNGNFSGYNFHFMFPQKREIMLELVADFGIPNITTKEVEIYKDKGVIQLDYIRAKHNPMTDAFMFGYREYNYSRVEDMWLIPIKEWRNMITLPSIKYNKMLSQNIYKKLTEIK